jgi:hypothetical protein
MQWRPAVSELPYGRASRLKEPPKLATVPFVIFARHGYSAQLRHGARTLAFRTNTSIIEAEALLRTLARTYPVCTDWQSRSVDAALLRGYTSTGLRLETQRDQQYPTYRAPRLPYAIPRR